MDGKESELGGRWEENRKEMQTDDSEAEGGTQKKDLNPQFITLGSSWKIEELTTIGSSLSLLFFLFSFFLLKTANLETGGNSSTF